MNNTLVFEFDGGVGDILSVYNDRIIISHKGVVNALTMGLKGDKTVYYSDLTSVQFKKAGWTGGYLQFSINGGRENVGGVFGATQDENTITISAAKNRSAKNDEAEKIYNYINDRIKDAKNNRNVGGISPSDEIRKLKSLLDDGIISQQEFDAKKKQLLGL